MSSFGTKQTFNRIDNMHFLLAKRSMWVHLVSALPSPRIRGSTYPYIPFIFSAKKYFSELKSASVRFWHKADISDKSHSNQDFSGNFQYSYLHLL